MTSFVLATIVLPMFPIYKLRSQTVKGHRRLLMAPTIQAALPVCTIFPPIGIYGLYHLRFINVTIIEYLVYVFFAFYPAQSPMITIYFVKPYNMAIQKTTGFYMPSETVGGGQFFVGISKCPAVLFESINDAQHASSRLFPQYCPVPPWHVGLY
ncbi:unnamed protein product, partial [Mesorhabditis spiculigera]